MVVQDRLPDRYRRLVDVVLPAQVWTEREGSLTSGERRVQRFIPAIQPTRRSRVDGQPASKPRRASGRGASRLTRARWLILLSRLSRGDRMAIGDFLATVSAAPVFMRLTTEVPVFAGLSYQSLAEVKEQWPIVGRGDLYDGGTTDENAQGLGVQLPLAASGCSLTPPQVADFKLPRLGMMAFPVNPPIRRGATLVPSELLQSAPARPYAVLGAPDAELPQGAGRAPWCVC